MISPLRASLASTLSAFETKPLAEAALSFWRALGYESELRIPGLPADARGFAREFGIEDKLHFDRAFAPGWESVHFLFQLTGEEIAAKNSLFTGALDKTRSDSYLFFAIALGDSDATGGVWARGKLAQIARELNRPFASPILVLFKHRAALTLAVVDRRAHKTDTTRDVLEKVTLIKDINLAKPHAAHQRILEELELSRLKVTTWAELHAAWRKVLDLSELNKKFFRELSDWYFWARPEAHFPAAQSEEERSVAVIRLITRAMFVYFIKERGLVPPEFFDPAALPGLLKDTAPGKGTYYNAVLQNLFFAALNSETGTRGWQDEAPTHQGYSESYLDSTKRRYREMFRNPDSAAVLFERVPFLNGGLFECLDTRDKNGKETRHDGFSAQEKKRARVPNFLFWGDEQAVDLNEIYQTRNRTYHVRPLLEILNRYNFTVAENTPLEEEVALDPELLGKVFENLLASYNPETRDTARRQTGSFYTPREIVDYMVEEALVAYLETTLKKDAAPSESELRALVSYTAEAPRLSLPQRKSLIAALGRVTILDPACGSGAFPMGCLHRLTHLLQRVDPGGQLWQAEQQRQINALDIAEVREAAQARFEEAITRDGGDYVRKLYLIERCLFGVDIQPIAVQISKLRFFISLVVEQKLDPSKPASGVQPLPNLETRIVAANSLINPDAGAALGNLFVLEDLKALAAVRRRHFSAQQWGVKKKLRERDEQLRHELEAVLSQQGVEDKTARVMAAWDPYDQNSSAPFFESEWMFGPELKDGFDIIIGNPPYIGEKGHKERFRPIAASPIGLRFYMGKMDIFYFFFHVGLDLVKEGGIVDFITTNYYPTATGALKLRRDFKERAVIRRVVNFNEVRVFESALGQHNMVTVLQRGTRPEAQAFVTINNREGFVSAATLQEIVEGRAGDSIYIPQSRIYKGDSDYIVFHSQNAGDTRTIHDLLNMMAEKGRRLDSQFSVNQGIVSGADKVSPKHLREFKLNVAAGTGIFVLSNEEVAKLNLSSEEAAILKPWFKNSDVARWVAAKQSDEMLIFADTRLHNLEKVKKLRTHLMGFKAVLDRSTSNSPYLHRPRGIDFNGPKIVTPQRSYTNTFAYNEIPWFASADVYFITSKNGDKSQLKFLLGLLNSRLFYWWFYYRGKRKGDMLELYQVPLAEVPIPNATPSEQKAIEALINRILKVKQANANADISHLENEIDALVYRLYGLDEVDIAVIEGTGD